MANTISFSLTEEQEAPALLRGQDVMVTAGAGSGKTRTLVARYLFLLLEGLSPSKVAAITFTEKAAREMRSRIRAELERLRQEETDDQQVQAWEQLQSQMDAARIGTIHSLCAEILRSHPAEAGVDPAFEVLDEGASAALRAEAVEQALTWALGQAGTGPLFEVFEPGTLRKLAGFALARRLDLDPWPFGFEEGASCLGSQVLLGQVQSFMQADEIRQVMSELKELQASGVLRSDAGEILTGQIERLLEGWAQASQAAEGGDLLAACSALGENRKENMALKAGGKTSRAKKLLQTLRGHYDEQIGKWLDSPPDARLEASCLQAYPAVKALFEYTWQDYRARLQQRGALDFDDLEAYALLLLERTEVAQRWQEEIQALLVDEFQDTNGRQRRIIQHLVGENPGRMFAVGDDRQSIYRFRGADVTVFHREKERIARHSGAALAIDRTFRTHTALLSALGDLLELAMACPHTLRPPYWVSYSPLLADRQEPMTGVQQPFIEFLVSLEGGDSGRTRAAQLLVQRLLQLKQEGELRAWDQAALLFRASTGFSYYEDALEQAGVPFVTVSGRGFYDRPEVRDVLNLLRALADPTDDLAMAGLLRSPAFGLADASLYLLRWAPQGERLPAALRLVDALHRSSGLPPEEAERCRRALAFIESFAPQVDRLPVAELLKRVLDDTDYRAVLAGAGSRQWRNLDKLQADAHASRLLRVSDFLNYLQTLRDVGVREGEAPVEAAGAVQLMTVHKSKGLEFPFVVLADASYSPAGRAERALLVGQDFGSRFLAFRPDRGEGSPLLFNYLRTLDADQEKAEEKRLLYVAATRAREKLLVSGRLARQATTSWLKSLVEAAGLNLATLDQAPDVQQLHPLPGGGSIGLRVDASPIQPVVDRSSAQSQPPPMPERHLPQGKPLYTRPAQEPLNGVLPLDDADPDEGTLPTWPAIPGEHPPSLLVGKMVHRALQYWTFPGSERLALLLKTAGLEAGLIDERELGSAQHAAVELLARLQQHPLWQEINAAQERHTEVPYTRAVNGGLDWGYIDLLYRTPSGWHLVEFKSDELRSQAELEQAVESSQVQMRRYTLAVRALLGNLTSARICFLDDRSEIHIVSLPR